MDHMGTKSVPQTGSSDCLHSSFCRHLHFASEKLCVDRHHCCPSPHNQEHVNEVDSVFIQDVLGMPV